jgi:NADH dehydrogenase (ubiquinone) flavoprotein 2
VDHSYNNKQTPFDFTPANYAKIEKLLSKFPANYKQSAMMPMLFLAQEQHNNWLPLTAMDKVAEILDLPPIRVYEVATFYTMYNRDPVGKHHIQVCGTTSCMVCGAEDVKKAAKEFAGITDDGMVSPDGRFCVTEVECLGACTNAPMVQVNNHEFYENLTPATMKSVMQGLLDGTAKPGPQNGQRVAEGPQGSHTLQGEIGFPKFRDIDALLKEEAAKKQAAAAAAAEAAAKK